MPCTTAFNPADALLRAGWETICNVKPLDALLDKYFLFVNESLSANIETIQRESIFSNAQRPEGLPSKIVTGGDIAIEVDAEGHAIFMANIQQRVTVTEPAGGGAGVYDHLLAPSATTEVPATFTVEAWRDDNQAQLFVGSRVAEMAFSIAVRTLLTATVTIQSAYTHYWADAVQTTTAGAGTAVPFLRNYPAYSDWVTGVDGDIYLRVKDASGLPGALVLEAKVSAAAAYGAADFTITNAGVDANGLPYWFPIVDSNGAGGAFIGSRDMPVEVFFDVFTGLANTDEWRFDRDRGEWTPVFPDIPPFNEIFATITIDAEEFCLEQVDITITRPVVDIFCIGGRFADRTLRRGIADVTGSIQRQYLDTDLRKRLERQEPFKLKVQAYSGEEIIAGWEHAILIVCPKCIANGATTSVTAVDDYPETLDFSSHPSPLDGEGYVDDATIVLTNSIADLTV